MMYVYRVIVGSRGVYSLSDNYNYIHMYIISCIYLSKEKKSVSLSLLVAPMLILIPKAKVPKL